MSIDDPMDHGSRIQGSEETSRIHGFNVGKGTRNKKVESNRTKAGLKQDAKSKMSSLLETGIYPHELHEQRG
jgi:hypothetical protein